MQQPNGHHLVPRPAQESWQTPALARLGKVQALTATGSAQSLEDNNQNGNCNIPQSNNVGGLC